MNFQIFHALNYAIYKYGQSQKSKIKRSKETGQAYKARSLSHSALGYQSSLERLLAGISVILHSVQFKSVILESNPICRIYSQILKILTRQFLSLIFSFVSIQMCVKWVSGGYFPAICRLCLSWFFCSFNPNQCYENQWRLFSGYLPGMVDV